MSLHYVIYSRKHLIDFKFIICIYKIEIFCNFVSCLSGFKLQNFSFSYPSRFKNIETIHGFDNYYIHGFVPLQLLCDVLFVFLEEQKKL